jgi:hypothetical protein
MANAYNDYVPDIGNIHFRAVKTGEGPRSMMYGSLMMGVMGILLMVFPFLIRGTDELTLGWGAVIIGLGAFILITSVWEAREHRWLARPGQVEMDGRSIKYYEDGYLMYEIDFGTDLKVGVSVNYSLNRGRYKPLYGIEFHNDDHSFDICYTSGYSMTDVDRLWPNTLAIIKAYDPKLTWGFRKHLQFEKTRGGYWAHIHDQLMPQEECPFQEVDDRPKGGQMGESIAS